MSRHPFLYAYAKANQMQDHEFTDDVCICYAFTKKHALKKFKVLYKNATIDDIGKVYFTKNGSATLTDY